MGKRGKKYLEALQAVNRQRKYPLEEAISLAKRLAFARFDETVEIAIRLGVNPRHADQMVRGGVVLPHGTGKPVRVLVFAKGEKEQEAREAGADYVGAEDLVAKIQEGWLDFDRAVATPDMMSMVSRLGRILGPRGLMPNPRSGTVTFDLARVIREIKTGRVEFRVDRTGIVHAPIGKVSFPDEALQENARALLEAVVRAKPATAKGQYLQGIAVASTMGPGIKVDNVQIANQIK